MKFSIDNEQKESLLSTLKTANLKFQETYPGDKPDRQAVHTVYGGANLFKADSAKVLGQRALETFHAYAPDFIIFGKIFGLEGIEKVNQYVPAYELYNEYISLPADKRKQHPAHLSYQVYNKVI